MLGRRAFPFLLLGLLALSPPAAAEAPYGLHLVWGQDPTHEVVVVFSGPDNQDARVEYGTGATLDRHADAKAVRIPEDPTPYYQAHLSGLEPNTTYSYRALFGAEASSTYAFRTAPSGTRPFEFLAWGDQSVPDAHESDDGAPARTSELAAKSGADFFLESGDVSYAEGNPHTWADYFRMTEPAAATRPLMAVPGNHERENGGYSQYDGAFPMPGEGAARWYAFRYANAEFIGLDTEQACRPDASGEARPPFGAPTCPAGPNEAQRKFLESTLRRARTDPGVRWIVVFHHFALFSQGPHGSNEALQDAWEPLYNQYGVDLVLQAHDHLYLRSRTLASGRPADHGTTYVVAGTGGADFYDLPSGRPEWLAAATDHQHGVLDCRIDEARLHCEFVDPDGHVHDAFSIEKDAQGRPHQLDAGALPLTAGSASVGAPLALAAVAVAAGVRGRRWSHR